jgi:iron complex transport system ATP-binding protein
VIKADSLCDEVRGKTLLQDVSFSIQRGESIGIIGPNGAGKSTLLRHLAGLNQPTSGSVSLHGKPVHHLSPKERARQLAILMQKPEASQHYTALEIVKMARYPYLRRFQPEGEHDRAIVHEMMEKTCTLHLQDRPLNLMSGGELQRVFLARALAQEPELLLLDEPTTYLDLFHQHELLSLLQREKEQNGLTWIAVLHDLNLAAQYCDRILLLAEGQLVKVGYPQEIMVPECIENVYGVRSVIVENAGLDYPQLVFLGGTELQLDQNRTSALV